MFIFNKISPRSNYHWQKALSRFAGPVHAGPVLAGPLHAGPVHAGPVLAEPLHVWKTVKPNLQ